MCEENDCAIKGRWEFLILVWWLIFRILLIKTEFLALELVNKFKKLNFVG